MSAGYPVPKSSSLACFFVLEFGQRAEGGGQNVSREFGGGGGKRTAECALQNPLLGAQKLGVGLVGASFF